LEAVEKHTTTEGVQKKKIFNIIQTEHSADKLRHRQKHYWTKNKGELRGPNNMELIGRTETVLKLQSKITLHI